MRATGWIQAATNPSSKGGGRRKLNAGLDSIIGPTNVLVIGIAVAAGDASTGQPSARNLPCSRLRNPRINWRAVGYRCKIVTKQYAGRRHHDLDRCWTGAVNPITR